MIEPSVYIKGMLGDVLFNTLQPLDPEEVRIGNTGYLDLCSKNV